MTRFDAGGGARLYAGGRFNGAGAVAAAHVAVWDGAQWSALGAGLDGPVNAHEAHDDGGGAKLYAGGTFTASAGGSVNRVARWDGANRSALGAGPALYAGNGERFRNGRVERFAPAGDLSASVFTPFDLQSFEDESGGSRALFLGGHVDFVGIPSRGLARWSNPCGALRSFCTAKVNSLGCTPAIAWSGEPSVALVAGTPFVVTATNVLNQRPGLLYYGVFGAAATPFQGGVQCVRAPFHRTPIRSSGGNSGASDCSGQYAIDFSSWIDGTSDPLLSLGTTVRAQWWSRDPASPSGTGLSNALEFEVRP